MFRITEPPIRHLNVAATALALAVLPACHKQPTLARVEVPAERVILASEAEGREMPIMVRRIGDKFDRSRPRPIVLLLHGYGDDERSTEKHPNLHAALSQAVEAGQLPPLLLVSPRGERGQWANWHDGSHRYRDYVLDEVLPHIESRFPVTPGELHLVGVSMGGAAAIRWLLRAPERYTSVSVVSAPVLGGEGVLRLYKNPLLRKFMAFDRAFGDPRDQDLRRLDPYVQLIQPGRLGATRLAFVAGTQDLSAVRRSTAEIHELLVEHGVAHDFVEYCGGHKWRDWGPAITEVLRRQMARFTAEP